MRNNHDELDVIIDGALSGYSEASPLPGLEQRVLNRIRVSTDNRRRRFRLSWSALAFAMAALLIATTIRTQFSSARKGVDATSARIAFPATPPEPPRNPFQQQPRISSKTGVLRRS